MPQRFFRDARRWIRHQRDLQGFTNIFPQGGDDPGSPRIFAPWIADVVQPTTPIPPLIRTESPATPAAGAAFSRTIPLSQLWRLITLVFTLATDATAGNRVVRLELVTPTGATLCTMTGTLAQPPSTTEVWNCAHFGNNHLAAASQNTIPFFSPFWLPPGYVFRTSVVTLAAGDQISTVHFYYELWPG